MVAAHSTELFLDSDRPMKRARVDNVDKSAGVADQIPSPDTAKDTHLEDDLSDEETDRVEDINTAAQGSDLYLDTVSGSCGHTVILILSTII